MQEYVLKRAKNNIIKRARSNIETWKTGLERALQDQSPEDITFCQRSLASSLTKLAAAQEKLKCP